MLIKVGSVVKLAKAAEAEVTLSVEKIVDSKREGCIYFRARAISAGDQGPKGIKWNYNGNLDYFAKKELLKAYATFVGRNLFLNHDTSNPLKAVGKVLDSYPVEDPETGEFYIECLARVDKNIHRELAGMIENGDLNSVSMGASCGSSMCSVCGVTIHSDQDSKCAHFNRLGQQFEAEVDLPDYGIKKGERVPAFCINSDLTFSELSIVSVPADSAALIKTVIAAFNNRLQKTAAQKESTSIVAELDTLLGLLTPEDREAVKKQICTNVGSCKVATETTNEGGFKVGDEVEINNKPEWTSTKIRAISKDGDAVMLKWDENGENFWVPIHNITRASKTVEAKKELAPDQEEMVKSDEAKEEPAQAAVEQEKEYKHTSASKSPEVDTILSKLSGLEYERLQDYISQKMKAKDNSMENLKAEGTPEVNKVAEIPANLKPHEEGMPEAKPEMAKPEDKAAAEMPAPEAEKAPEAPAAPDADRAAHEEKEVEQGKDEIQKLDEAAKLIKEVKQEIKQELKADEAAAAEAKGEEKAPEEKPEEKKEEPKAEEAPAMEAMSAEKPALSAKFNKQPFLSRSFWTVSSGDKVILTATLRDICGEHLKDMRDLVTSPEYGDRLIARINSDGLDKIAALLNSKVEAKAESPKVEKEAAKEDASAEIKTSYEAGEHLVAKTEETAVEKKAGACPCGKAECPCDCMLSKECACSMASMTAAAQPEVVEVVKETKTTEVSRQASKESPETLSEAEKPSTEPEGAKPGQSWDKNKNMFNSDKTESDEAKAKEVGKEAKLEKGEMTLSESEKDAAHPTGGIKPDLMEPVPEAKAAKEIGKEAKLEPGEMTLDKAEAPAAPDAFKPKMGTESSVPSDEAKAKEIGREAALNEQIAEAQRKVQQLEAELNQKATELAQEKMERSIEAKMIKCRKLVEEMVKKDLLAESQETVEKYLKQGQSLLDARKSAIRETVDLQLASFMQMPDSLLKVQAETITRMKKTASPISDKLRIPVQGQFNINDADETAWMDSLPWS